MKPTPFALAVLAGALVVSPAAAGVRIDVDPGAPFTERDLADAVQLRDAAADDADDAAADGVVPGAGEGDGDVVVRVAKLGLDQLVITVGGRSQVVALPDRDRVATTRVVALVVTSMLDRDAAEPPPLPPATVEDQVTPGPRPARTLVHVGTSLGRDDNGYVIPFVHAGLAYAIAPRARLVGRAGLGQYSGYLDTSSVLVPVRVGIEGHSGAAAIELGGQVVGFRESSCGAAQWGSHRSVYGAAKVFLPLGGQARLVGELGGHFVASTSATACNSASNYTSYGGWMGLGIEWAR